MSELLKVTAIGTRRKNIHLGIEIPLVTPPSTGPGIFLDLRLSHSLGLVKVGIEVAGCKEQSFTAGRKKAAGGSSASSADALRHGNTWGGRIEWLHVDLIKGIARGYSLIAHLPSIGREIPFPGLRQAICDTGGG